VLLQPPHRTQRATLPLRAAVTATSTTASDVIRGGRPDVPSSAGAGTTAWRRAARIAPAEMSRRVCESTRRNGRRSSRRFATRAGRLRVATTARRFDFNLKFAPQRSKVWVIYLAGGGACDDLAAPCSARDRLLTTTSPERDRELSAMSVSGIGSSDAAVNPTFATANHVRATYCSSDFWAGAATDRRPSSGDPIARQRELAILWRHRVSRARRRRLRRPQRWARTRSPGLDPSRSDRPVLGRWYA
jgi:hypothetical protein